MRMHENFQTKKASYKYKFAAFHTKKSNKIYILVNRLDENCIKN